MKTTRLIAAIALAFAATTATAAKKLDVKVIGSRDDGIQYWVKYTINGVEYRSDQALERVNQLAWENMSDEDKETVVCKVHGVWDARKEQFGEGFAAAMGRWYDDMKGYVEGGEILTDRLVERDYPGLVERFSDPTAYYKEVLLSDYECGDNTVSDTKIDRLIAEKKLCFDWACEAYQALRRAEYLRTAAAVKSTSGDLIQLITDRVLVPNITPAGVGGMSAQIIGACFDHINTLTGMQDSLTKEIVGERATAGTALKVIENADIAIKSNYSFMQTCMERAQAAKQKIDSRYKELEKEAKEEEERRKRFDEASRDNSRELSSVEDKTESIVKEIERLQEIIKEKETKANKAYQSLQKAKEAKEKEGWNPSEATIAAVKAAEAAYEAACVERGKAIAARDEYIENKRKAVAAAAVAWRDKWIGADGDGGAIGEFWKRVYPYPLEPVVDGIVWASDPDVLYSNEGASAVSSAKSAIKTFISERKKYYASQEQACKEFEAIAIQAYVEGAEIISDGNAVGYSAYVDMRDKNGFSPSLGKRAAWGADYCDDDMKRWTAVLEGFENYDAARSAYNSYNSMSSARTEGYKSDFNSALAEYDATIKELEAFEATVPEFVKEQRFADTGGMLFLDADTELGRAFLADDAPRSIEAANGYRNQLNELVETYNALYEKMNVAKARASANLNIMRQCGVSLGSYTAQLYGSDYKGRDPAKPASLGKLKTLHRDFNNRNVSHEQEIVNFIDFNANYDLYSTNIIGHYLTTYTEADHNQEAEDPYLVQVAISANYGRHTTKWSNPDLPPGYYIGYGYSQGRARILESTSYTRGLGSYAYYAKGYYESIAGSEPDPYEDLVKPTVAEIDAARAAYEAAYILPFKEYTVTFERNGGGGADMEPQVFMHGVPQALNANIWSPPFPGDKFVGWATYWDEPIIYTNCQVITVTHDMTLYARWSGEYGGGEGGGEVYDPSEMPTLFAAGKAETAFMGDATYNGWVRNADGSLAGLLTVKAAKAAKPEKGGQSKLTITYTPFGGKKQTIKLANDAMPVAGGVATVAIPGVGTVKFTDDALVGVNVDVQAGKDMLKSRDRGEKAAATAAAASKAGVWTFALGTDAGFAAFSVTVDKKGKGKLAGAFPDGTKVSVSAQGVLGDGVLAIPFTYAKKGTLGFVFWVKGDGTAALSDLTGDVGGSPGTARPTIVAPSASHRLADGEHVFTAGDVSQAFTVAGKKWNVPRQNKRAEVDPNPTGLKLAFTEKTGAVKGTFTVVNGKAKTKYTVVGAVVGGKFYGSAYVRKAVPIPATAE